MSPKTEAFEIVSSIVRGHAPKWLDLAGFNDEADELRSLPVIKNTKDAEEALIAIADVQEGVDAFLDESYTDRGEFNRVWSRANEVLADTALTDLTEWLAPLTDTSSQKLAKVAVELVHDSTRAAVIFLEATGDDHEIDLLVEDLSPEHDSADLAA